MSQTATSAESATRRAGSSVGKLIRNTGPLFVLLIMLVILWATAPAFRSPSSWMLLALEAAAIGVVAAGQTFVILTGGIDLSVEAMVSFSGVVAAILIAGTNMAGGQIANGIPSWLAIPIALAAGTLIGLVQGLLITQMRMNPLIVTLGFRSMLLGAALVWTRGAGINIQKDPFLSAISGVLRFRGFPIPTPFLIALVIYGIGWFVLRHTKLGRYTYAMGGNETAARLSGINVDRYKMIIYGISGFLASIAGVMVMGRLQSGAYQNGTNMTLTSVAAVVIGGTSLSGGVGGIWGTMVGVFIMRLVEAGLVYLSVPSSAKEIVIGAIILLAVALDVARQGQIPWLRRRRKTQS
jgi:ribose transport system permease protein